MKRVMIILLLFTFPAHAVVIAFPPGSVDVKLELQGDNCGEPWALICVTSLDRQRAYLLSIPADALVAGESKFVGEAYRVLLRRSADAAGRAYWSQALATGAVTREQIIDAFVVSSEYRAGHP